MTEILKKKADEIIGILTSLPQVKKCTLYGSIAEGRADSMSDIDIEADVSGYNNGEFMLSLPDLLSSSLTVVYSDFAPSLIPEKYIVSLAIDEENPFMMLDISCAAEPHMTTVTRQQAVDRNRLVPHTLKVWTANLKHHLRGQDCRGDILRMAKQLGIDSADEKSDTELLAETLGWLEENAEEKLVRYVQSCRRVFSDTKLMM